MTPASTFNAATALLDQLCCRLAVSTLPVCDCNYALSNPPPADYCCSCLDENDPPMGERHGQGYVALDSSTPVIADALAGSDCLPSFKNVTLSAGIYRCAPVPDDQGVIPSPADIADAFFIQSHDEALLYDAVFSAFDAPDIVSVVWSNAGPLGACMRTSLDVTVTVGLCAPQPCEQGEGE